MIPTLLVYSIFIMLPIVVAVGYSFTKYSGIGQARFIGLKNYVRLFQDEIFWISLKNTMVMFILAFVLLLTLSFQIALLLNKRLKGVDFSKALIFSPAIIAPIIVGIIWVYFWIRILVSLTMYWMQSGQVILNKVDWRRYIVALQHRNHIFLAAVRISCDHIYCRP